jgi:cytochrome c-type biogenesis protein CcmF
VRVHVKPFVRWIWAGALLMALGGLVTATDRVSGRAGRNRDDGKPQGVRA